MSDERYEIVDDPQLMHWMMRRQYNPSLEDGPERQGFNEGVRKLLKEW